jgi:hypothetical protein
VFHNNLSFVFAQSITFLYLDWTDFTDGHGIFQEKSATSRQIREIRDLVFCFGTVLKVFWIIHQLPKTNSDLGTTLLLYI